MKRRLPLLLLALLGAALIASIVRARAPSVAAAPDPRGSATGTAKVFDFPGPNVW